MLRCLLPLAVACLLSAETEVAALLERKLMAKVAALDERTSGVIGVAAIDLNVNRPVLTYNGDVVFPQASSIKIPILIEMFAAMRGGKFNLEDKLTLEQADKVEGSGHLKTQLKDRPVTLTIRELITAMMETSDNTATNKCISLTGMDRVNARMDALGFRNTRLKRIMMDGAAAKRNDENISTPLEMARLMELIYRGNAIDGQASSEIIKIMKLVKADFRKAVPASVEVAAKPGGIPGVKCETGVVLLKGRPFVLSVMTTFAEPGNATVLDVAKLFYDHFETLSRSNRYGHKLQ